MVEELRRGEGVQEVPRDGYSYRNAEGIQIMRSEKSCIFGTNSIAWFGVKLSTGLLCT